MPLFVGVPVSFSGMFGDDAAGNHYNAATLLHPVNKLVAVVALVREDQLSRQIKGFQQCLRHANVIAVPTCQQKTQWIPKPIRYRMDLRGQPSPASPGGFVVCPFFTPLAC